jgi:uncharacterized protein (TIGR03437 family)
MSHSNFTKILVVLAALLACVSLAQADVSPLNATPSTVALTFQKPATPGSGVAVLIKATASTAFTVDATTVPIWLGLSAMSGTADGTGATITFSPPQGAVLIGAGSYYATVKLDVVGATSLTQLSVPVSLVVSDPAPTLTATGGAGLKFNWTQGSPLPTKTITVSSSNEPLGFTVAAAVTSPTNPAGWIQLNHTSGVAYSWGTPVVITFNPLIAYGTTIGAKLTGTVTITPNGAAALTPIDVEITVAAPVAAITSLFPPAIPVQTTSVATDMYTIAVSGSGFVSGTTVATVGGDILTAANGSVVVVNDATMMLLIQAKKYLETEGPVAITAYNSLTDVAANKSLTVTSAPIIYAVTNGASYQQQSPGAIPNVAPYELVSIFGDNFGPTGTTVVPGVPDTTYFNFPTSVTSGGKAIVVNFYKADGTTLIGPAPLLFASQQQINAVVPAGVAGNAHVHITVTYNAVEGAQQQATVVTADPGIFSTAANGTGQGAILNSDYSANSASSAATKAARGSTVMIYMAGLGAPTSTGANTASATAPAYPKSCITTASYMTAVNTAGTVHPSPLWANIDGAVIQSALLAKNVFPPCLATAPTVTIGGKAATVTYAGFVADSVGGLYQINATISATATVSDTAPVVVSIGTLTSQPGVTMAVK